MLPTFAYLDPVTGSALFQILLAVAAAAGLGYQYIRRGFSVLKERLFPTKKTEEENSEPASV